jgi:hypothetical protein
MMPLMKMPERPVTGRPIPPGWFGEFYDCVRNLYSQFTIKQGQWMYTPGASGEGGSTYESPFTVTQASDTSVKVVGATTNTYKNYIALGNSWVELTEQTVSSITSTGWLYIEITYSGSYTLTAKFSASETPPTRDNTHGIILVRRIVCASSVISSINLPTQIVEMGGKIF